MFIDHVENFLLKSATVDIVIAQSNRDEALVIDNARHQFLQALVKIVEREVKYGECFTFSKDFRECFCRTRTETLLAQHQLIQWLAKDELGEASQL